MKKFNHFDKVIITLLIIGLALLLKKPIMNEIHKISEKDSIIKEVTDFSYLEDYN